MGFDAPATSTRTRRGRPCSFAALVHERLAAGPVLVEIERIVQAADFNDQLDQNTAARGLRLMGRDFPLVTRDYHDTVQRASFV
ncbi:MAG: chromate resistance protein ChrB domain-containing protein [Blastocatellia bacterium]